MADLLLLQDLLEYTRDGEWGKGEPGDGLVEMAVIRGTDFGAVRYGDTSSVPTRFIPEKIAARKTLQPGDILLETAGGTKDQPTGRTVYLSEKRFVANEVPFTCASFSRFLRAKQDIIDPRYLFWYLQSIYETREMLPYHIQHTGVARFQYTDFASQWRIPVPNRNRQVEIAELLGSLDDKIELNRRMNETLEAMAQAIFRDWFVDFGPTRRKLEGAADPITIMGGLLQDAERAQALADLFPAALGDDGLPEGWTERAFGAFVEIIGGGTPKTSNESYWNGSIPWFSVTDTPPKGSIFVDVTEKTISEEGLANSSARLVRAGTTIISARGTVGNLALTPHEMTFNQSCYGLQGNAAVGDCFAFLAAQNIVERLKGMAHGSVFSTITRSTFDNIQLAYTPDEIFEAFESLARPMFDKVLGNVKESRTLAATRDLLLPKLMSGEIRLQSAENPIEVRV